jgi:hypothetical protein
MYLLNVGQNMKLGMIEDYIKKSIKDEIYSKMRKE